jgi:hypothetical protein
MELEGITWYSPIGSYMKFELDGTTGIMSGTYHTAPGGMTAKLTGRFDPSGPGAIGWTVSWPKGNYPSSSETSWVANVKNIDEVVIIESSWMIREQLNGNSYYSTVCGCEDYTREPPSEKTIELNKNRKQPHPL